MAASSGRPHRLRQQPRQSWQRREPCAAQQHGALALALHRVHDLRVQRLRRLQHLADAELGVVARGAVAQLRVHVLAVLERGHPRRQAVVELLLGRGGVHRVEAAVLDEARRHQLRPAFLQLQQPGARHGVHALAREHVAVAHQAREHALVQLQVQVQRAARDVRGARGRERAVDQAHGTERGALRDAEQHRELLARETARHREDQLRRIAGRGGELLQLRPGEVGVVARVAARVVQRFGAEAQPELADGLARIEPCLRQRRRAGHHGVARQRREAGTAGRRAGAVAQQQADIVQFEHRQRHAAASRVTLRWPSRRSSQ